MANLQQSVLPKAVHSKFYDEEKDSALKLYCTNGAEAVTIKIIFNSDDLKVTLPQHHFKPAMVHQIFGFSENVYGFRNLSINICYMANSAKCFIDLKYSKILHNGKSGTSPFTTLTDLFSWLPKDFYTNKKQFISDLEKEDHSKIYGNFVANYEIKRAYIRKFEIRECCISENGFSEFHKRFESMIVWFIDAASQIDVEDPNWIYIYVYEHGNYFNDDVDGRYPVGFCTIYKFFHYPDKIRARISQFFVIPSCQGKGIGTALLSAAYKVINNLPNVVDITVEDPSSVFTRIRDFFDCRLLMQLNCFQYPTIKVGFTKELINEANYQFKINKRQCRRIYNILRFVYLANQENTVDEYNQLCHDLNKWFEASYTKEQKGNFKRNLLKQSEGNSINQSTFIAQEFIQEIQKSAHNVAKKLGVI